MMPPTHYGSAISLDGVGVLIRGVSGSGKSRLAYALVEQAAVSDITGPLSLDESPVLRAPDRALQTGLIGDDRLVLSVVDHMLVASPAKGLEGLIEVRGLGLLSLPWRGHTPIHAVIDLVPVEQVPRLPEPRHEELLGQSLASFLVPIGDLAHQKLLVRAALRGLASTDKR